MLPEKWFNSSEVYFLILLKNLKVKKKKEISITFLILLTTRSSFIFL